MSQGQSALVTDFGILTRKRLSAWARLHCGHDYTQLWAMPLGKNPQSLTGGSPNFVSWPWGAPALGAGAEEEHEDATAGGLPTRLIVPWVSPGS